LQATDAVLHRLYEERRIRREPVGSAECCCVGRDLLLRLDFTIKRFVETIGRLPRSQDCGRELRADRARRLRDLIRLRDETLIRGNLAVALTALHKEVASNNDNQDANCEDE